MDLKEANRTAAFCLRRCELLKPVEPSAEVGLDAAEPPPPKATRATFHKFLDDDRLLTSGVCISEFASSRKDMGAGRAPASSVGADIPALGSGKTLGIFTSTDEAVAKLRAAARANFSFLRGQARARRDSWFDVCEEMPRCRVESSTMVASSLQERSRNRAHKL